MNANVNNLTDEQRRAVMALEHGSVLVLAGPGSGKTHTLLAAVRATLRTNHTARLLCLTFTTKTADNIRGQLPQSSKLFVGTFHALAVRLLQTNDRSLSIIKGEMLSAVYSELKRSHELRDMNIREVGLMISRYKNGSLDSAVARQLVAAYDRELHKRGLLDYDDLILQALHKASGIQPYDYIFVDEFQDTSPKQYELLQTLTGSRTKLFVIGDPKQSIYHFRGADGSVFARLQTDTRPHLVNLTCNYRSAREVVRVANLIFADQLPQIPKRSASGIVQCIETLDEYREPAYISHVIEQALGGTEWQHTHHDAAALAVDSFQDFAVLYRTRRQGALLARKLRAAGLPVQCLGEDSPYASPQVQLMQATLAYIVTPDSDSRLRFSQAAILAKSLLKPAQLEVVDSKLSPCELIRAVAEKLHKQSEPAILQLENLAAQFTEVTAFLDHLDTLAEQAFFDPAAEAVCLSTVHSSKGLEFRHVFITGCNEGLLPSARAVEPEEMAEEKRLFYVAVTRARDTLTMLHTRRYGGQAATLSAFLKLLQVPNQLDEGLAATEQIRARHRQKRAQQRLF